MKAQYEAITPLASNAFKAFLQEKKAFDAPWHYHPEFELTLILSSRGLRYVGNKVERFIEDDLVLMGPNLPHCWKNTHQDPAIASAIVIQWKEDFLGKGWMENPEFTPIRKLLQASSKGLKFDKTVALRLRKQFLEMLDFPPFEKLLTLLQILNELAQTNQRQVLCEQNFSNNLDLNDSERINEIYQYVEENYQEKITLATVAAQVNMGEESFSRFFSKTMKKPFFTFLNEYRVSIASKLLIETDLQVIRVCYNSGYESLPFFYRQFKKFKAYSPQKFRAVYQKLL